MAQPLSAFTGSALYVDAMLIAGFLDSLSVWHAASRRLMEGAVDPAGGPRLVTASLTLDETAFALMQESLARPPYNVVRSRSQYLQDHPAVVRQLTAVIREPLLSVLDLLTIEPVLREDVAEMAAEMSVSGILPRDAIHVAVMRRLGLTAIASDDDAFERCAGVTLYKP
jgi:predicted nucleic acid-binding protein